MKEIVFKTSKKKIARMFGIFSVAMPLSALAAYFAPRILNHVIGLLPLILIGLIYLILVVSIIGFVAGLIRLIGNKFDLILNSEGIRNRAEFGVNKLVKWDEIEKIELNPNNHPGIAIFLKNPQTYIDSFSGLKKQGVGLINIKYGTPCFINVMALQADAKDVFIEMRKFLDLKN
jgi:hypothetical protein